MAKPRTNKSTIGRDPWDTVIPALNDTERAIPTRPAGKRFKRPPETPLHQLDPAASPLMAPIAPAPKVVTPVPSGPLGFVPSAPSQGREKLTIHLDGSLVERVKNAAYWNPRLTIARIAEVGIRLAIEQVEHENGGAYPHREAELSGGRPIK
jgi:hypothetical protein